MDAISFKAGLERNSVEITLIRGYNSVWIGTWPEESRVRLLNRYSSFFQLIRGAVLDGMLLAASRALDRDGRTAGLPVLLEAVRKDSSLVPYAESGLVDELELKLASVAQIVKALRARRNKRIAHFDLGKVTPASIQRDSFEELTSTLEEVHNTLSSAHDRSVTSWVRVSADAERHTQLLLEELRIGAEEHLRRMNEELLRETGVQPSQNP